MRTDIDKVKQDILNRFKELNEGANHVLSPRWLPLVYLPKLTPAERQAVRPAILSFPRGAWEREDIPFWTPAEVAVTVTVVDWRL